MPRPNLDKFLLSNRRGYTHDLCDISGPHVLKGKVELISDHILNILGKIENRKGPVGQFVIGKTFARRRRRNGIFLNFNATHFNTWKLAGGINGRWYGTYNPCDFDG
jgi:hypothetical protein